MLGLGAATGMVGYLGGVDLGLSQRRYVDASAP
jgi:hypothetical protein